MRKLTLCVHVSLDGFAAGNGGAMNWIHVDEEIFDYISKTHEADTGLYGRVTYEMMQQYWPTAGDEPNASKHDKEHSSWFNRVEKVVISRSLAGLQRDKTTIIGEDLKAQIEALKQKEGKEIVMFGSLTTAHALMRDNLIDEFLLFVNPVLIGEGTALFPDLQNRVPLNLVSSKYFTSGVICLHYALKTGPGK